MPDVLVISIEPLLHNEVKPEIFMVVVLVDIECLVPTFSEGKRTTGVAEPDVVPAGLLALRSLGLVLSFF